jgi:hypothetical protein
VPVELDFFFGGERGFPKEVRLDRFWTPNRPQDRFRGDALMNMERNKRYLEGCVLSFASPDQLGIQVRVVLVTLGLELPNLVGWGGAGWGVVLLPGFLMAIIFGTVLAIRRLSFSGRHLLFDHHRKHLPRVIRIIADAGYDVLFLFQLNLDRHAHPCDRGP